jgi:hypothetical protein
VRGARTALSLPLVKIVAASEGRTVAVMAFMIVGGGIVEIDILNDPRRLKDLTIQ